MECLGVADENRRFVLKSLLETLNNKSDDATGGGSSETIRVAIAAMTSYSSRNQAIVRAYLLPHLTQVVEKFKVS